jgi:hypothetical protein
LGVRTKGKVPELLTSFDLLAFFNSGFDTTHHHSTDTYGHNAPKSRTVDRNDLASVFAIDIEGRANGLGLRVMNEIWIERGITKLVGMTYVHSVVFARNISHRSNGSVNW